MGPAAIVPIFWTAFATGGVIIGSHAVSAAVASNNYVAYKL